MVSRPTASADPLTQILGLEGKKAVVVGGGLGMGKETARLLSRAGASVAVVDIDESRASGIASEIAGNGGKTIAIAADALDKEQAGEALRRAAAELDGLDVLVTIVGMPSRGMILELDEDTIDLDLERNMRYALRWARNFAQIVGESGHGGTIVCIASVSGLQGAANHGAYGAAKAALISLVKTMAIEWGGRGIRVNAIAPGATTTDRVKRSDEINAGLAASIPLGRPGEQMDIAKVVLFLASDLSSYMTGQTLVVDGGATIKPSYSV
jgi:NAD(P)-dependent dehydrogenase (short-subunit alcohol dehydrogenase family)